MEWASASLLPECSIVMSPSGGTSTFQSLWEGSPCLLAELSALTPVWFLLHETLRHL